MPRHHARASRRAARRRRDRGGAESSPYSKLRDIALSWLIRCDTHQVKARAIYLLWRDVSEISEYAGPSEASCSCVIARGRPLLGDVVLSGRWHPAARRPAPGRRRRHRGGPRHVLLLPGLSLRVSPHAASHGARAHEAEGGRRHYGKRVASARARAQRAHRAVCVCRDKAALSLTRARAPRPRRGAHSRRRIGRAGTKLRRCVQMPSAATARHCTKCSRRARPTSR